MTLKSLPLFAALMVGLSGCVIIVDDDGIRRAKPKPDAPVADACGASGYQSLLGASLAAVTLPEDVNVRVIRPGDAVTMDHREDRMNIELDDDGTITRVYCG